MTNINQKPTPKDVQALKDALGISDIEVERKTHGLIKRRRFMDYRSGRRECSPLAWFVIRHFFEAGK